MHSSCSISNGVRNCKTKAIGIPTPAKREPPLFLAPSINALPTASSAVANHFFLFNSHRCGEHFPRGRLDSLTSHLTKKCPAISEAERVNALLTLSGMSHASHRFQQSQQAQAHAQAQAAQASGSPVDLPMVQHNWTALGVLAEVSRQIDLNEKNDDRGQPNGTAPPPATAAAPGSQPAERFELQEQFTIDNPPLDHVNDATKATKGKSTKLGSRMARMRPSN